MQISDPIIFTLLWRVRLFVPSLAAFGLWVSSGNRIMFGVFTGVVIFDLVTVRRFPNVAGSELMQDHLAGSSGHQAKLDRVLANLVRTPWTLAAYFAIVVAPIALAGYFGSAGTDTPIAWGSGFRFYLFGFHLIVVLGIQSVLIDRAMLRLLPITYTENKFNSWFWYFAVPYLISLLWPEERRGRAGVSLLAIWFSLLYVPILAFFCAVLRHSVVRGFEAGQILAMTGMALFLQLLSTVYFVLMGMLRQSARIVLARQE
jgi:hypothetical protein